MNSTRGLIIISWWICMFLCGGSITETQAQLPGYADSIFASGNWRVAAVEYERVVYESTDPKVKAEALISKAECYKRIENYKEAFRTSKRISFEHINDTLATKARYQAALSAYMDRDFKGAESEFLQMQFYNRDSSLYNNLLFLHVLILNEQRRWEEAQSVFSNMIQFSVADTIVKRELINAADSIFSESNYPKLKSADKAVKWATFLPGSGHIYAGYTGEGIMNFALQLVSLGFTGYHVYISHYITAFTIGTGMIQHFYFGGINRVQFLVEKRNYINQRKFNDPLKQLIINAQQKLYP